VKAGENFTKSWVIRNDGDTTWPEDTLFVSTNGDDLKADPVMLNEKIEPGNNYTWEVECTAPQ